MNVSAKTTNKALWLEEGDIVMTRDLLGECNEVEFVEWGQYTWLLLRRFRHVNAAGGSEFYFLARNFVGQMAQLWVESSDDVWETFRNGGAL
jgi:hypothetical protein